MSKFPHNLYQYKIMKVATHNFLINLMANSITFVNMSISSPHHATLWQQALEKVYASYNPVVQANIL